MLPVSFETVRDRRRDLVSSRVGPCARCFDARTGARLWALF